MNLTPRPVTTNDSEPHLIVGLRLTLLLAVACGVSIANVYAPQVVAAQIGKSFNIGIAGSSAIVTLFQLGYLLGLVLLVPLGDLVENKKLITRTLTLNVAALLLAALADKAGLLVAAALIIGSTTTAVQMLVPLAAHFSPAHRRGRVVGTVMSGLLLGALLCRPAATLIAGLWGWRALFFTLAVATAGIAVALAISLPKRQPTSNVSYARLLHSLGGLLIHTPVLQRRATYHALLFAAFSIYWTSVPWVLSAAPFSMHPGGIALFMLSGAAGVFIAPLAGWAADHGYSKPGTVVAFGLVAAAFILGHLGRNGSVAAMVAAGILLDAGVQANLVLGQRAIYMLAPETRSRLNGLYLAIFFAGGAIGSSISGAAYALGGWSTSTWLGLAFPIIAFGFLLSERK